MAEMAIQRDALAERLYQNLEALPSSKRLTKEQLEVMYGLAYTQISQERYDQALPLFAFLSQYGPTRKHYLVGLGVCLQMVGREEDAINIYSVVLTLYPNSLTTALRVAECHIALKQFDQARRTLQLLAVDDAGTYADVATRAKALLQLLAHENVA